MSNISNCMAWFCIIATIDRYDWDVLHYTPDTVIQFDNRYSGTDHPQFDTDHPQFSTDHPQFGTDHPYIW